ncbi:MAG: histone deacetylase family protein [Pseudomonadota bacterium]
MQAVFDRRQQQHDPQRFVRLGQLGESPEQPERAERLLAALERAGIPVRVPNDHGTTPIAQVHSPLYLQFLETIHARWVGMPGASDEVLPNVHPRERTERYPDSPIGQAGYHQADTACPIGAHTWTAAYWSAQTALTAASALQSNAGPQYALCRPPGHHACAEQAGGFCFLNNAAIAAQHLLLQGARPAVLDIDVHHGNGTQQIFYHRDDVLTVSLHADPMHFYPFFVGHPNETGAGRGAGYNINLPMPLGSDDNDFIHTLDTACGHIARFGADVLVVALGLDAHESDPLRGLAVTTSGFSRIGARIGRAGLPTVFIQEGGYLSEHLSGNLEAVLTGFTNS